MTCRKDGNPNLTQWQSQRSMSDLFMANTHPLGTGTANLTFNEPVDAVAVLREFAPDQPMGNKLRFLVLAGLEKHDPALAAKLEKVYADYYGPTLRQRVLSAVLLALFFSVILPAQFGRDDFRLPPRQPAVRRGVRKQEELI